MKQYAIYWVGVTMALACFVLAFAGNTAVVLRFTPANVPLSWVAGAIAITAFLIYEFSDSTDAVLPDTEYQAEVFQGAEDYAG